MNITADSFAREDGFRRSTYADVVAFFDEANVDYDSDLVNPYWSFTHLVLKFILRTYIAAHFQEGDEVRLFDAGAGTGNWSNYVLGLNPRIRGTLFDMNPKMLRWAQPKMARLPGNQVRFLEGNLEQLSDFPSERSNLILCMHNVIGLARHSERVLRNLCTYMEDDGIAFIMAPNAYHALRFTKRYRNDHEVSRVMVDRTVKFKDDMPEMFCYTPLELQFLLRQVGFEDVTVLGFPITVGPEMADTRLLRSGSGDPRLMHTAGRAMLLEIEKTLSLNPTLASRGTSSLIAVCRKSSGS